jgi:hypothetical protein
MSLWLYNSVNKKFVLSSTDSNSDLINIPKDEISKIGAKNVQSTIEYIERKNLTYSFLHFSAEPIQDIKNTTDNEKSWDEQLKSIYYNPFGLWLSIGDSWLKYVQKHIVNPSMWNLFSYIYEVKVNNSVLIIKSKDELYDFIKKFKNDDDKIKIYDVVNWALVKNEYNGLIILGDDIWNTFQYPDRMIILGSDSVHHFFEELLGESWKTNMLVLSEWVRHWETKSGVIWSEKGIDEINLIKTVSF